GAVQVLAEVLPTPDRVGRELHGDRRRPDGAEAADGKCGRALRQRVLALQDQDLAAISELAEVIESTGADDAAADDDLIGFGQWFILPFWPPPRRRRARRRRAEARWRRRGSSRRWC